MGNATAVNCAETPLWDSTTGLGNFGHRIAGFADVELGITDLKRLSDQRA